MDIAMEPPAEHDGIDAALVEAIQAARTAAFNAFEGFNWAPQRIYEERLELGNRATGGRDQSVGDKVGVSYDHIETKAVEQNTIVEMQLLFDSAYPDQPRGAGVRVSSMTKATQSSYWRERGGQHHPLHNQHGVDR